MNAGKMVPGFLLALEFWESGEFSVGETWLPGFESQYCAHSQLCILGQVTQPLCASASPELFSKFKWNPYGILSWNYHEDRKKGARCSVLHYLSFVFSVAVTFTFLRHHQPLCCHGYHSEWCLWGGCSQWPHDPFDLTPFSEPGKGASATWLWSHGL